MLNKQLAGFTLVAAIVGAPAAVHAAEPNISAERFRAHTAYLSDDLLEGREAGRRGHELAARYIATQLALMGLKPAGEDGGWYQSVGLADIVRTGPAPTVTLTGTKGAKIFTHAGATLVDGPTAGGEVDISGDAVFVGYGVVDRRLGLDDYKGLDVRGKIVVALRAVPKGIDSEAGAHLFSEQARQAAEHGAVGLISVRPPSVAKAMPWARLLQRADEPRTTWVRKDSTPYDPNFGLEVRATLDAEPAALLFEGARRTWDQVAAQAESPRGQVKGFALKVKAQIKVATEVRRYSSPEVIGLIEGSDPKLKSEYVILMGHADHLGVRPSLDGDGIYNGALDNAAGVATLLEVANAFARGVPPRRSVLIIANTAEEKGLLGAEFFARYPTVPADKIVSGIDLDMPLLTYDFTDVIAFGADHSTLSGAFSRAGATMGVALTPDPNPQQAVFVRSDHYALVKAGIPAVMLATGVQNGGAAAWTAFLEQHYHQPSDDMSQPILWSAGAKFAKFNYLVARDLADSEEAPRWYAGDYFGDLFAPKAVKAARPAPSGP